MRVSVILFLSCVFYSATLLSASGELIKLETNTPLRAVYLYSDPELLEITVYPVIIAGEADFDGPEGLAHYLEHLMYWHADNVNDAPFHGRSGNAWANGLVTGYFNTAHKSDLNNMMEFAARLLTKPALDKQFMLDERKVVEREYDFRVSEDPGWQVWSRVWSELLPDNPAGRSVIGTPESIRSMTLSHAIEFNRKFYTPANMVLLISGNVTPESIVKIVNARFGRVKKGDINEQLWRKQPPKGQINRTITVNDRQVKFPAVVQARVADWAITKDRAQNSAVIELLGSIMNSALEGGIAKPLRMNQFVFQDFYLDLSSVIDGQAMFHFNGRLDEGVTPDRGIDALSKALHQVSQAGIPQQTIDRVRKRKTRRVKRLSKKPSFLFEQAAKNLSFGFLPETTEAYVKRLDAVTKDELDDLLEAIGKADRMMSVRLVPAGE